MVSIGDDTANARSVEPFTSGPIRAAPPGTVRFGATIDVPDTASAVVAERATVLGTLSAGRHRLDPDEHQFLGALRKPRQRSIPASLYVIDQAPTPDRRFSGQLDDIVDPATASRIQLRCWGSLTLVILAPEVLVGTLGARVDLANPAAFDYWLSRETMRGVRRTVVSALGAGRGLADLLADTPNAPTSLDEELTTEMCSRLAPTGMAVAGVDELELRQGDGHATVPGGRVTPGVQVLPWPEGRCHGCGEVPPTGARYCPACGAGVSTGDCARCSSPLVIGARFCTSCGADVADR